MLTSRSAGNMFGTSNRRGGKSRLVIALGMAVFALISYFASSEYNPVTGEKQHISLTPDQEIALGLQATPEMIQQYGGLDRDDRMQRGVDAVGTKIVNSSDAKETPWKFEFHLLDDDQTVNAFALPGGQIFITDALLNRLETEAQLAGVLGHEAGHVVARHGAQHIAKSQLTNGLIGAVAVASESEKTAMLAAMVGQLVNMKYGRDDELESDRLGVRFMAQAGYDPRAMIRVMEILAEAGGGNRPPEFFSTHPNPENRIQKIREAIEAEFPNGVPEGLTQ
ncbi:MAG: M48 family metallopeptidase [Candidatus Kapaibacterium sp.]